MKEEQIIELIKNGKIEKAFVKLYKIYPKVRLLLKTYGVNKEEANDIFQDALVSLYNKLQKEDFSIHTSIETYLINTCKYMGYKLKKDPSVHISEHEMENFHESEEPEDNQVAFAEKALMQLGEKCRELLLGFYIQKLSMTQIAKQFSYSSENVAKTQKYKCLEAVRKMYNELRKS